jgi:hypothetical protein
MDDACKDTYNDVMSEAAFLQKHEILLGIFALDTDGNFTTIQH